MSERQGDASPFEPAGLAFTPVSSGLIKVRLIGVAVWLGLPLLGVVVLAILFPGWWWAIPGGVLAALIMWLCWLIPRQVRSIGYAERDEDLFIRKGIVFRQLTVVPYGRMQYVRSEEHTSELQSRGHLVCRLLLAKNTQ